MLHTLLQHFTYYTGTNIRPRIKTMSVKNWHRVIFGLWIGSRQLHDTTNKPSQFYSLGFWGGIHEAAKFGHVEDGDGYSLISLFTYRYSVRVSLGQCRNGSVTNNGIPTSRKIRGSIQPPVTGLLRLSSNHWHNWLHNWFACLLIAFKI